MSGMGLYDHHHFSLLSLSHTRFCSLVQARAHTHTDVHTNREREREVFVGILKQCRFRKQLEVAFQIKRGLYLGEDHKINKPTGQGLPVKVEGREELRFSRSGLNMGTAL